jgi:hypothetical protein
MLASYICQIVQSIWLTIANEMAPKFGIVLMFRVHFIKPIRIASIDGTCVAFFFYFIVTLTQFDPI